jgi:hypothetical protein
MLELIAQRRSIAGVPDRAAKVSDRQVRSNSFERVYGSARSFRDDRAQVGAGGRSLVRGISSS